ncbi:MAG: hypothetical protein IKK75_01150 [Clostridia bacterium]|nr:hypothetical protein [Clostridia bacterium]
MLRRLLDKISLRDLINIILVLFLRVDHRLVSFKTEENDRPSKTKKELRDEYLTIGAPWTKLGSPERYGSIYGPDTLFQLKLRVYGEIGITMDKVMYRVNRDDDAVPVMVAWLYRIAYDNASFMDTFFAMVTKIQAKKTYRDEDKELFLKYVQKSSWFYTIENAIKLVLNEFFGNEEAKLHELTAEERKQKNSLEKEIAKQQPLMRKAEEMRKQSMKENEG